MLLIILIWSIYFTEIIIFNAIYYFASQVKVLYVRNLTQATTEDMIKESFEEFGGVERVKKIKDYAFVHYEERDDAVKVCTKD